MRDERLYLDDIIQASGMIASFLSGMSEEEWADDEQLRSAVTYQLIVIGEAASRVSQALRARHSEVPWPDVVGFRNLAVHAYFAMDPQIVWITAKTDVPALAAGRYGNPTHRVPRVAGRRQRNHASSAVVSTSKYTSSLICAFWD